MVRKDGEESVEGLESKYHLVEPVRLTMCERKVVGKVLAGIIKKCKDLWPLTEVYYLGMFPRHIGRCCEQRGHMTELDAQVIQGSRMDLEADILDEVRRVGETVTAINWFTGIGMDSEPTVEWLRRNGVVSMDCVHMSKKYAGQIARFVYCRLVGMETDGERSKRMRMNN